MTAKTRMFVITRLEERKSGSKSKLTAFPSGLIVGATVAKIAFAR